MLWPDPSSSGSPKQGQWGLFAVLWLKTPVVVLPVFAFMFVKCRAFEAGVTGKCSCSVTGPSEPPLASPSHTPGSLHTGFQCCEFARLLLLARQSDAGVCRAAREAEPEVLGSWEKGESHGKCESGACVLSLSFPLCHFLPFLRGRQS